MTVILDRCKNDENFVITFKASFTHRVYAKLKKFNVALHYIAVIGVITPSIETIKNFNEMIVRMTEKILAVISQQYRRK